MKQFGALAALALAGLVLGCNGAAATGKPGSASPATTVTPASPASTPAPGGPAASAPPAPALPPSTAASSSAVASAPAPAAVPSSAVWSYPGAVGSPAGSSTGVLLKGTIPPDPTTAFSGVLFMVGERILPGSTVLVSYQASPVAWLPGIFTSSEVLGIDTVFLAGGDYTLAVIAPDGTSSAPLALTVAAAPSGSSLLAAPEVHMVWPASFDTSFAGTAWIMGDHFEAGAVLAGTSPVGSFVAPLLFVNERTLGWVTATPVAGSYSLQVVNPTLAASATVTVTVGPPSAVAGLPAPGLVYAQSSVASPFVGTVRVFGSNFVPGAVLELTDAKGNVTSTPLLSIASDEVWWELFYPAPGTYQALVRNPDGQATPSWPFTVN